MIILLIAFLLVCFGFATFIYGWVLLTDEINDYCGWGFLLIEVGVGIMFLSIVIPLQITHGG